MKKIIMLLAFALLTACSGPSSVSTLTPDTSNNEDPSIIKVGDKYYMAWFSTSSGYADLWMVEGDGTSWSQPRQITEGEGQEFYPTLAYDNGTFHLSFFRIDPETRIANVWYARSADGIIWEEEQITDSPATDWTPRVMAHDGTVYIVWTSNRSGNRDIFITKNSGDGWATPQQLTNSPLEEDFPYLAFINDEFYLTWSQFEQKEDHPFGGTGSKILLSKSDNPIIWPEFKVMSDESREASDTLPTIYNDGTSTYLMWTSSYRNSDGDIVRKRLGSPFYQYITKLSYPNYSASSTGDITVWAADPEDDGKNKVIQFQAGF